MPSAVDYWRHKTYTNINWISFDSTFRLEYSCWQIVGSLFWSVIGFCLSLLVHDWFFFCVFFFFTCIWLNFNCILMKTFDILLEHRSHGKWTSSIINYIKSNDRWLMVDNRIIVSKLIIIIWNLLLSFVFDHCI